MNNFILRFSCVRSADVIFGGLGARQAAGRACGTGSGAESPTPGPLECLCLPLRPDARAMAAIVETQWKGLLGTRVGSAQE